VPDLFNRIMLDYGRKMENLYASFGYQPKVTADELGETLDTALQKDSELIGRAKALINSVIEGEIGAGHAGDTTSSLQLLADLYNGNAAMNPAWKPVTDKAQQYAYIYNTFAPGFDNSAHGYSLRDQNALNRVATASYVIEYNNLAREWSRTAGNSGQSDRNRVRDITKKVFGLVNDRPQASSSTARMTVWDDKDMNDVPHGSGPSKKNIKLYWMDGLHPNRVSATENLDVFRDYWNGRHGGDHWQLRGDQIRQVSGDW
jgi:hypothetical protein